MKTRQHNVTIHTPNKTTLSPYHTPLYTPYHWCVQRKPHISELMYFPETLTISSPSLFIHFNRTQCHECCMTFVSYALLDKHKKICEIQSQKKVCYTHKIQTVMPRFFFKYLNICWCLNVWMFIHVSKKNLWRWIAF